MPPFDRIRLPSKGTSTRLRSPCCRMPGGMVRSWEIRLIVTEAWRYYWKSTFISVFGIGGVDARNTCPKKAYLSVKDLSRRCCKLTRNP